MGKHVLSKSTFIRGLQCLKSLYLHKHRPFLRDRLSATQLNKFDRGHEVGALAHSLFPGGINCAPHHPSAYRKSVEKTTQLILEKFPVIYEATLQANEVLVMADILVLNDETWDIYEVKSSLKISQTYIYDVALQYYVLRESGIPPGKAYLMHVNQDYLYEGGEIDPMLFFRKIDVTSEVVGLQDNIKTTIEAEKKVLEASTSPAIPIGTWCFSPYPCDFIGHCWKNEPPDSVALLQSITPQERFKLKEKGILSWKDLLQQPVQNPILRAELEARSFGRPFVDSKKLREKLEEIKNPVWIYLLAAENAIPMIPGTQPFEPVPRVWGISTDKSVIINAASRYPDKNPLELCKDDAYSIGINDNEVFFTWGSRAVSTLKRLFPHSRVEDLTEWLWSSFLYFPYPCEDTEPWLFASQAGLMNGPNEKSSAEDVLRKIQKDAEYAAGSHMSDFIRTELSALKLIFHLVNQLAKN